MMDVIPSHSWFPLLIFATLGASLPASASAQMPTGSKTQLGVDMVTLDDGKRVFGIVLGIPGSSGTQLLIERKWLQRTHPELFRQAIKQEQENARQTAEQFGERVDRWIQQRSDEPLLVGFLNDEKQRVSKRARQRDRSDSRFLLMQIPAGKIRTTFLQPAERKRIAGLAWEHGLENVTVTSVKRLRRQLTAKDIDVDTDSFDLSDEVPFLAQSERTWMIRRALVEHHYRGGLEFQGTRANLLQTGEKRDLGQLMTSALGGSNQLEQIGRELGIPEFQTESQISTSWWKKATDAADKDGFQGVLVSVLDQSLLNPTVKVDVFFFAKISGRWESVVQFQAQSDANQQQPEDLEKVQNDPQLAQVIGQLRAFGLDPGHPQVQKAIRHGAATAVALEQAKAQFSQFMMKSTRKLDTPFSIR